MPSFYQGPASFFHGLSDLWLRFFRDTDTLKHVYRGTELLTGQAYLDLLSKVLNFSVRETPVFDREWFKLLTIREDQVEYDIALDRYVFELPDNIKDFQFLYNRVFAPTTVLEKEVDFQIDIDGETDDLRFWKDPFDWDGAGNSIPGIPSRNVDVLNDDDSITTYKQLAFWIPEAKVDGFQLYLNYGYLLNRFEPSSESYRALLQGIMRYFVLGPTFTHLRAAMNVLVGLPLIRDDGEILQEVDTSDDDEDVVITDKNRYVFTKGIPLREDITNTDNWGTLEFDAFEYITTVFMPADYISDPSWWHDIVIPQRLLPDEPRPRRIITPDLFENSINNPSGLVKIGDPGFIIGADDDGFVPTGRPALRHLFSYVTFERFLKHHVYTVVIDNDALSQGLLPFPRSQEDVQQVVMAGASAYLFLYLEPDLQLTDTAVIMVDNEDDLDVKALVPVENVIVGADNNLVIGTKSWKIGDYYKYGTGDVLTVQNEGTTPYTPNTVDTWVVIGGTQPSHRFLKLYDTSTGGATFTSSNYLSNPAWRLVVKTAADSVEFDQRDIGKYVKIGTDDGYYQILDVVDGLTLIADGGPIGSGLDLTLWEEAGAEEGAGAVDWPVQVRVIP